MSGADSTYGRAMGIARTRSPDGREILLLPFRPELAGRPGFLHGGAIAGFLGLVCDDAIEGYARSSARAFVPISTSWQFLRGGREREIYAAVTILPGAKLVTVNATAWQEAELKPIASACRKYLLQQAPS